MSQAKVVENTETHILCSITFFSEKRAVYGIICRNMVEPVRRQYNTAHALCILDNKSYRHGLRICTTYSLQHK